MLGIEVPTFSAPIDSQFAGRELVAMSHSGGPGVLQAQLASPPTFYRELHGVRELVQEGRAIMMQRLPALSASSLS